MKINTKTLQIVYAAMRGEVTAETKAVLEFYRSELDKGEVVNGVTFEEVNALCEEIE